MDRKGLESGDKPPRNHCPQTHEIATTESLTMDEQKDLSADAAKLVAMEYKPQMKRELSTLQLVGVAFMVTASCLGVTGGFSAPASLVYGLIIVGVFNIFFVTSLSELVSAMPNAGGQYYWVSKLAPKKLARVSAYFTGICHLSGGIIASAYFTGICHLSGGIIASAGAIMLMGHVVLACAKLAYPH